MEALTIDPRLIRPSPIAGSWYPGRQRELRETIRQFLDSVQPRTLPGELVALIAPHAGYIYSGPIAAHAYRLLEGKHYDVVAVISPSHRYLGGSLAVTRKAYYNTPLGHVEVARDLVEQIGRSVGLTGVEYDEEHSLEIQLPFLQYQLGEFKLVPIMMQDQTLPTSLALGDALAGALKGRNALLVASTDLSHFHPYAAAVALDRRALDDMAAFDAARFSQDAESGRSEACGYGAVAAVLTAARALGADTVTVLAYANSGDVTGDRERVVGYGAAAVTRPAKG